MSSYTAHHQTPRQDDDKKSLSLRGKRPLLPPLPLHSHVLYTLTTDYSTQ